MRNIADGSIKIDVGIETKEFVREINNMGNTVKTGLQKLEDSVDSSVSKLQQLEDKQAELTKKVETAKQALDEQAKSSIKYAESMVAITGRQSELSNKIDTTKQSITEHSNALEKAKTNYANNVAALEPYKQKLDEVKQALNAQRQVLADNEAETRKLRTNYLNLKETMSENATETIKAKQAYEQSRQTTRDSEQAVRELRAEYNKANQEYKQNVEVVKQSKDEVKKLDTEYKESEKSLNSLEKELKQNSAAAKEVEKENKKLESEYKKQQQTLDALEKELEQTNGAIKEQKEHLLVATSGWVKFKTEMSDVSKDMKQTSENLKTIGSTIADIGKKMSLAITAPLVALGTGAVKAYIDFESAFAGVKKTVDATTEQFALLEKEILNMSKTLPTSATEIAAVAEMAGQLGVKSDDILKFTRVMIDLGESTNLNAELAASSIAKFANITGMSMNDVDKLGSVIVDLGNNFATTEADIMSMAMRLVGAGTTAGFTEAQILGVATALSSVGIEAEMGGSAISKVISRMQVAVETSSKLDEVLRFAGVSLREMQLMSANSSLEFTALADSMGMTGLELNNLLKAGIDLENFAKVAGMTGEEFKTAFQTNGAQVLQEFIVGLGDTGEAGETAITVLQEMGLTETRLRDSLLRSANARDVLTDSFARANSAWDENNALTRESEQRYATLESRIEMVKNQIFVLAQSFGELIIPYVEEAIEVVSGLVSKFENFDESTKKSIITIAGIAAAIGPVLVVVSTLIQSVSVVTGAISTFAQAVSLMGMTAGMALTPTVLLANALTFLQGAFSLLTPAIGLAAIAIGAIVLAINHFANEQKKAREELLNSGAALKELGTELDNVSAKSESLISLIDRHKELTAAIQSNTLSEQEAIATKQELSDIEDQLIAASNGLLTSYDKENRLIGERLPLLQEVADAEAELARMKLQNKVNDMDIQRLNDEVAELEDKKNTLFETARVQQEAVAKLTALEANYQKIMNSSYESEESRTKALEDFIVVANEAAEAVGENVNRLGDFEFVTENAKRSLNETTEALEAVTNEWRTGKISQAEYEAALEQLYPTIDETTDAIDKQADATKNLDDAQSKTLKSTDEYRKKQEEYTKAYADAQEEAVKRINDTYEKYEDSVISSLNKIKIAEQKDANDKAKTHEQIRKEMQETLDANIKANEDWITNLETLEKKGFAPQFIEEMRDAGVEQAKNVEAWTTATDEEMENLNASYVNGMRVAMEGAKSELNLPENLDMGAEAIDEIASRIVNTPTLREAVISLISEAKDAADGQVKNANIPSIGENVGEGVIVGIRRKLADAREAGRELGRASIYGLREGLEVKSPSKAAIEAAEFVGDGVVIGTENKTEEVARSGENLAKEYISRIEKGFDVGLTDATGIMLGQWTELNQGMKEIVEKSGMDIVQAEIDTLDKLISETEKKNAERNKAAELADKERAIVEAKTHDERIKATQERDKLIAANELEAQKEQLARLKEQQKSVVEAYTEMNDAIVAALKEKYAKEKEEATTKLEEEVSGRREASKAIIETFETEYEERITFLETGKKQLEDIAKQEVQTRKDASKAIIEQYEEEYQAKLKTFDFEESSEISAIQVLIDDIDAQTESEDRALKQQDNQRKIHDLEQKLAQAETAEERIAAQDKLNEEIAKQSRDALLQQRKDEKESLKQQIAQVKDTYKQLRDAEKENIEEKRKAYQQEMDDHEALLARRLSAVKEQYEIDRQTAQNDIKERRSEYKQREEDIDKFLKEERNTIDDHYKALMDNERMQADARAIIIEGDQDKIISLLREYIPDWATAGRDSAQALYDAIHGITPTIESEVNRIMSLVNQIPQAQSQLSGLSSYSHQGNTPSPQVSQPTPVTYTVQQGDSLWSVSAKYGVSVDKLREANGLMRENDERLPIGKVLRIPILHEGGISTKEQLALIDNKEAVLPLAQLSRMFEQVAISTANRTVLGLVSSIKNNTNSITNNNDNGVKVELNVDYYGNGSKQDADVFGRFATNSVVRALRDKGVAIVNTR